MSDPYLILHKVRGEPAFDIAIKIVEGCHEGSEGHNYDEIWIIPTSGHRAYPVRYWELSELVDASDINSYSTHDRPYYKDEIPTDWPDHYSCNDRKAAQDMYEVKSRAVGLLEALNLVKKVNVERRF